MNSRGFQPPDSPANYSLYPGGVGLTPGRGFRALANPFRVHVRSVAAPGVPLRFTPGYSWGNRSAVRITWENRADVRMAQGNRSAVRMIGGYPSHGDGRP